eukprot:TRINITY_DN8441_c0_g1_i5.p3 TRINITY_DN8441_c0_g1~~TRINITY_DN8441_c0_g1_i5.p3  ORF type:complete len:294 (-),score=91.20 TRINITY_DN8441_c0_g1_i5:288-1169(-)
MGLRTSAAAAAAIGGVAAVLGVLVLRQHLRLRTMAALPAQTRRPQARVAVVTGGARGIGRCVVGMLAQVGMDVVSVDVSVDEPSVEAHIAAVRQEAQQRAPAAAGESGAGKISVVLADLSRLSEAVRVAQVVVRDHGRCDVLVGNAGIVWNGPLNDIATPDGLSRMFAINVVSHMALVTVLLPVLRECGARVVLVSSHTHETASLDFAALDPRGQMTQSAYATTKLMLVLLARHLNNHILAGSAAMSVAVHPGAVLTHIHRATPLLFQLLFVPLACRLCVCAGWRIVDARPQI